MIQPVKILVSLSLLVTSVHDGDTFKGRDQYNVEHKIRMYGIDAPELKQQFGIESQLKLYRTINAKSIRVIIMNRDLYGREVGKVFIDDIDVNKLMIYSGLAWYYGQYCQKDDKLSYSSAEQFARQQHLGIWSADLQTPPWEFRRKK